MTWTPTTNLKFCLLNAENLFVLYDTPPEGDLELIKEHQWQKLTRSVYENKPLKKCLELAKTIKRLNPDIVLLCEVGGLESLSNFNTLFLDGAYSPALIEGNSERNIDVGFLIRKGLPFYFDLQSNKNRPINYLYPHERESLKHGYPVKGGKITTSHKFSRDIAELRLFTQDKEKPFLAILLGHLKSRLDPDRIDPHGFERRQAELRTLLEIYQELEAVHPELPILVAGDFNGNAAMQNTDEEFKELYNRTQLRDVLELAQIPTEKRATFYQVRNSGKADARQIDYAFFSPKLASHLKPQSASVYRYLNELGVEAEIPRNLEAKMRLPSDHYPILFEIQDLPLK